MTNKNASNEVLVWDGDLSALPDLWQKFVYKEDRTEYVVIPLDGRKYVVDSESGDPILPMSIRMFPGKTGSEVFDLLFKSGIVTTEKLAAVVESKDNKAICDLFHKFTEEMLTHDDMVEWTRSRGITNKELYAMRQMLRMGSLAAALADLLS